MPAARREPETDEHRRPAAPSNSERLADLIGVVRSTDGGVAEDTGRVFADLLAEQHAKQSGLTLIARGGEPRGRHGRA
jgi:hypothetical protein